MAIHIRRREFIFTLGAAATWPLAAHAQRVAGIPHVGYLSPLTASVDAARSEAFRKGLRDLGYIEPRNIVVEYRFAEGRLDRLPLLATELVGLNLDVIIAAGGSLIARAVKNATGTIPIVMTNAEDPVANGLVASLARPGGNVTGLSAVISELSAKRLELLSATVSNLARVAVLWNPAYPEKATEFNHTEAAARTLSIEVQSLEVRSANEVDNALDATIKERVGALVILPDPLTNTHQARIVEFAEKRRLPTMFTQRPPVELGGLMSYGPNYANLFRRAATYVDKILKGTKPADLPVEQPTKFEWVINLKTAKLLGLAVTDKLLALADEVIE
jgi:putative tryptophan/tyrosine transport system substrate-binding protein